MWLEVIPNLIPNCSTNTTSGKTAVFKKSNPLSWLEHRPTPQKVVGLIPSQGTYLGCGLSPWLGVYGRQPTDVSLSRQSFSARPHPLHLPLSLKSVNISSGEE